MLNQHDQPDMNTRSDIDSSAPLSAAFGMTRCFCFVVISILSGYNLLFAQGPKELVEAGIEAQETMAVIRFEPGVRMTGQIFYGTEHGKPSQSLVTITPSDGVEFSLMGLEPGRIYYFQSGFYSTNSDRIFFRNGAFRTKGEPELRLDSVEVVPEKYGGLIRVFVSSEMEGYVEFEGQTYPLKEAGEKDFPRLMGMNEKLLVYEGSIKNAKPGKKYPYFFRGKSMGSGPVKSIDYEGDMNTLENNIALGKPVTGTFDGTFIADNYQLEGDILSRVTDGIYDYSTGMAVSHDPEESDQWIAVDLGEEYPVDEVVCIWRAMAYPMEYQVSLSSDAKTWSRSIQVKPEERMVLSGMPVQISRTGFGGVQARFVRVFFPKGGKYYRRFDSYRFLQLVELKVMPKE